MYIRELRSVYERIVIVCRGYVAGVQLQRSDQVIVVVEVQWVNKVYTLYNYMFIPSNLSMEGILRLTCR